VDEATARFLVSEEGARLLDAVAALPGDAALRLLRLRQRGLEAALAAGAVEVVDCRRRARARFPDADRLFFDRDALAQATSPVLAAYHAERLARFGTVADLGCGAGMDAVALAAAGARVIAVERDAARLVFARANAGARGVGERIAFVAGDVTVLDWDADAVFWDPSRRTDGGSRVSRHAERYEPPLSFLPAIRERVRGGCVKLSPALPDEVLDGLNGSVEFLSERGECKEAALFFGEAAGSEKRAAVLLPEGRVVQPSDEAPPVAAVPGAFVHDPDPAIVRAGALGTLAGEMGAALVSADDVYLTSEAPGARPLVASYPVIESLRYQPRRLREALRARGIERLIVKKRHFPREPEELARDLRLSGKGAEAVLFLVREGRGHLALVCEAAREG
jgi:SAM-dependent methyltransferase